MFEPWNLIKLEQMVDQSNLNTIVLVLILVQVVIVTGLVVATARYIRTKTEFQYLELLCIMLIIANVGTAVANTGFFLENTSVH